MWWNENNQFIDDDGNILAMVEWDKEFNSWAYDNLLTACGETEIPTMEEAMEKAEASVRYTLEEREDNYPMNPPDTVFNLGLYGMF